VPVSPGPRRHAEIAGAGFAGLTAAILLARAGWTVRVHERADAIREIGAGIFLHNNGLLVLEELGLMGELATRGTRLVRDSMVDWRGRVMQTRSLEATAARRWSFPRQALIEVLHAAAGRLGVEIVTASTIRRAVPDGRLVDARGQEYRADLVVGADGHRSAVRSSLGLTHEERKIPTTSIRFLVPGRDLAPEPTSTEHWSRRRRVAFAAAGDAHTYVYMACPEWDETGSQIPLDTASWSEHFPLLQAHFELLRAQDPFRAHYSWVRARSWSSGRVVLLGDAAHALAPTLGQGSNLAMSNARSLMTYLEGGNDIPAALRAWERAVRPTTDATQRWASYYDRLTKYWPNALSPVRAGVIWAFGASPQLAQRLRRADRTPPITELPTPGLAA
jgi:2-polyprenyl-6-methoxyphenol hydroxylase-like FAD-dependent oxidoreductase